MNKNRLFCSGNIHVIDSKNTRPIGDFPMPCALNSISRKNRNNNIVYAIHCPLVYGICFQQELDAHMNTQCFKDFRFKVTEMNINTLSSSIHCYFLTVTLCLLT